MQQANPILPASNTGKDQEPLSCNQDRIQPDVVSLNRVCKNSQQEADKYGIGDSPPRLCWGKNTAQNAPIRSRTRNLQAAAISRLKLLLRKSSLTIRRFGILTVRARQAKNAPANRKLLASCCCVIRYWCNVMIKLAKSDA